MSSLLERMIQRTREPLSTIEPLLSPRYAGTSSEAPSESVAEAFGPAAISARPQVPEEAERSSTVSTRPETTRIAPPEPGPHASPSPVEEFSKGEPLEGVTSENLLELPPRPAFPHSQEILAPNRADSRRTTETPTPQTPMPQSRSEAVAGPAERDITISIGHIEVRGAPPAERPRNTPFRPRVSLDDFLKRNGERG